MPGAVNHESPPSKVRLIVDQNGPAIDNILILFSSLEELREGLEPAQESRVVVSNQLPVIGRPDSQLVLLPICAVCHHLIWVFHHNCESYFAGGDLPAFEDVNQVNIHNLPHVVRWNGLELEVNAAGIHHQGLGCGIHGHFSRQWPEQRSRRISCLYFSRPAQK